MPPTRRRDGVLSLPNRRQHHGPATATRTHFAGRVDRPRADPAVGTDPGPHGAPPSRDSPSISRVASFISAAGPARRVARAPRFPRRLVAPARGRGNRGNELPPPVSPGTLTSAPTPDRADARRQGYPHHGPPPGNLPLRRAQAPHPRPARARARAQRSPTRRGHPATAREGTPPIPPQATGDDGPGAQARVPKAKRAPQPRPKQRTTRRRPRAWRRRGPSPRAHRVCGVPRATPAGPLRRRQRR